MSEAPFSEEAIERAIATKDRAFLDGVLERYGVPKNIREFYMQSVPGRTGRTTKQAELTHMKHAAALAFYREMRRVGRRTEEAKAEMIRRFPMHSESAARLINKGLRRSHFG